MDTKHIPVQGFTFDSELRQQHSTRLRKEMKWLISFKKKTKLIPPLVWFFSNTKLKIIATWGARSFCCTAVPPRPSHLRTNYAFFVTLLTGTIKANVLALFFFFFLFLDLHIQRPDFCWHLCLASLIKSQIMSFLSTKKALHPRLKSCVHKSCQMRWTFNAFTS